MSGNKNWSHEVGNAFEADSDDEAKYKAWRKCKHGWPKSLRIYPKEDSDDDIIFSTYGQPMTIKLDPESNQLCVICHFTDARIFIEGHGLAEVAEAIDDKKAQSLHIFERSKHGENKKKYSCIINKITVEIPKEHSGERSIER